MAGIKEHLEQGIWCKKPPMGYSAIKEGKERKIIVNETGKKLRKAFHWKAAGIKNDEILLKLKAMGVAAFLLPCLFSRGSRILTSEVNFESSLSLCYK